MTDRTDLAAGKSPKWHSLWNVDVAVLSFFSYSAIEIYLEYLISHHILEYLWRMKDFIVYLVNNNIKGTGGLFKL